MQTELVRQTMFTAGEADEQVWKRTDIEAYLTAAQSLLNMECGSTALVKKRRGTRILVNVTAYAVLRSQMWEFIDKNGNYYLVFAGNSGGTNEFAIYYVDPTTGDLTFIQTIAADTSSNPIPYTPDDLQDIDYTLDNDSLVLTNPKYSPARIFISVYNANPLLSTFAYQVLITNFTSGPIYPLPAYDFGNINYNSSVVTMVAATNGSPGDTLTFTLNPGNALFGSGPTSPFIGGQILGAGQTVTQPIGYAIITSVTTGATTVFTAIIQIPFNGVNPGPVTSVGSQFSIRQPAWSSALGFPSAVTFYQNRLWFAGTYTLPTTIFGSRINQPVNFDVGVGNPGDAIIYNIGQNDTGKILWLNGGKQLEIYTQNYEFACPQDTSAGISPDTFSVRQQSSFGAYEFLKPTTYLNDSYFASTGGSALINFHFDGIGLTYKSSSISLSSQHLVKTPINRALQRGQSQNQDNFIYFVNGLDQTVTSFQFIVEKQLASLTPITFTPDDNHPVLALNTVSINNKVYFLKNYGLTGQYYIEIFDDAYRMDGVELQTVAPFSSIPVALGIVTGLTDYIGYNVHFVFQDQDFGVSLDINGNPAPVNASGVAYVFNTQFPLSNLTGAITVGILYENDVTPMYVYAGPLKSNYHKFITKIYVDYYESLDFQVDGVQVPFQSFYNPATMTVPPIVPLTGTFVVDTIDGWEAFNTFTITQSSPFDLQILGIAYQIEAKII